MSNPPNSAGTIPLLPPPPPSKATVTSHVRPGTVERDKNDHVSPLGEVQNAKNAAVFVFSDSTTVAKEINNQNNFELRPRGKDRPVRKSEPPEVVLLDREIKDGDTLEKFALLYGCSVSIICLFHKYVKLMVMLRLTVL